MTINIRPNLFIWYQTTLISADSLACCSHQFRSADIHAASRFVNHFYSTESSCN